MPLSVSRLSGFAVTFVVTITVGGAHWPSASPCPRPIRPRRSSSDWVTRSPTPSGAL